MQETLKNLAKAFVGESQARNRYSFYAKIAQKEGYEKIADIFLETAEHERQHAKWLFKLMQELKGEDLKELKVEVVVPLIYQDTLANLKSAIAGEHYENSQMYPEFAEIAEKEGLKEIANRLRAIAKAEKHHEERYKKILKELSEGTIFKKEESVAWSCRKCGYLHFGTTPPDKCPSCDHPKNYFEIVCENY